MPRNVRNFWVSASCDGRVEPIGFGPKSAYGGFDMTITMRDHGSIIDAVTIRGYADHGGMLRLWAVGANNTGEIRIDSER